MERYSAFKRREILIYATTCMSLEDIMLNEKAGHKKTNTVDCTYLTWSSSERKKVERWLPGAGGG